MIDQNSGVNVLPFYDSVEKQNHRKDYADGGIYPLVCLNNTILPFQIQINDELSMERMSATLIELNTGVSYSVTTWVQSLIYWPSDGLMYLINKGITPFGGIGPMLQGFYYLHIVGELDDDVFFHYYSEVFNLTTSVADFIKLEWSSTNDITFTEGRLFGTSTIADFKFFVYLPTQLGRPEYQFEEEVTSRDGFKFIEKQISKKVYKCVFTAPEYLCDSLRIVRLCDYIKVINVGGLEYDIDYFLMTVKWLESGYVAQVDFEFDSSTVVKTIGKAILEPEELSSSEFNVT